MSIITQIKAELDLLEQERDRLKAELHNVSIKQESLRNALKTLEGKFDEHETGTDRTSRKSRKRRRRSIDKAPALKDVLAAAELMEGKPWTCKQLAEATGLDQKKISNVTMNHARYFKKEGKGIWTIKKR